jgi:hypothetical protein
MVPADALARADHPEPQGAVEGEAGRAVVSKLAWPVSSPAW